MIRKPGDLPGYRHAKPVFAGGPGGRHCTSRISFSAAPGAARADTPSPSAALHPRAPDSSPPPGPPTATCGTASPGIGRSGPANGSPSRSRSTSPATCRRLAPQLDLIVVDCLTVWVANLLDRGDDDAAVLSAADELAAVLGERGVSLIVVSNEVGEGVHPPTEIGLRFRDLLGAVNQRIAAAADLVTLMVAGIPVPIKRAAAGPPWSEGGDRSHEAP